MHTYTVSELTRCVKQALEEGLGRVWVEGEISNLRRQASGHSYFTLKDSGAQLSAVLFAGAQRGLAFTPADGMVVRACGDLTVYEPRGQYQLVVRQLEAGGQGLLMARFEALKSRLRDEGLFDEARKRPLPLLPRHVGVVTSPSGAAIRDILSVVTRRFPNLRLLIAPARVQGAGAAEEIAAAIDLLNRVGDPADPGAPAGPPLDLLVITRGGGSLEDLWPFNEEVVARALARSRIPTISAVGHEIDFTISDFAADLRAPTPSAAAEMLVGRKEEFLGQLDAHARALEQLVRQALLGYQHRLRLARGSRVFSAPRQLAERAAQQVDGLAVRLRAAADGRQARERRRLAVAVTALLHQRGTRLQTVRGRLDRAGERARHALTRQTELRRQRLAALERQLRSLSPLAVLERGYSLTRTADGRVVRSVGQVAAGDRLLTRVSDGEIASVAGDR